MKKKLKIYAQDFDDGELSKLGMLLESNYTITNLASLPDNNKVDSLLSDSFSGIFLLKHRYKNNQTFELLHQLKQAKDFVPVVVCIDKQDFEIGIQYFRQGADEVFFGELSQLDVQRLDNLVNLSQEKIESLLRSNAVEQQERKLQSYIDYAPMIIFVTDGDGNYIDANNAAELMTGYSIEEILGMNIRDFLVTESYEAGMNHFNALKEGGEAYTELIVKIKGGKKVWWSVKAVKVADDQLMGFVGDITDRKNSEFKLINNELRYRTLVEKMNKGLAEHEIIMDESGKVIDYRFLEVNDCFEALTGLKRSEILGKTVLQVMPETESFWIETYGIVALTGEMKRFENYSSALDKYFEVVAYQTLPNHFATIFTDITENKKIELELRLSEEKYRLIAENSTDVLYTLDMNLNYTYLSPSVERLNGYTMEESLSRTLWDTMTPESCEKIQNLFAEEMQNEQMPGTDLNRIRTIETQEVHKNGQVLDVESTVKFLRDVEGKPVGVIGITRDMTERKRYEKELTESELRLRLVLNASQLGVYDLDVTSGKAQVNDQYALMIGYEPASFIETNDAWLSRIHPDDRVKVESAYRDYIAGRFKEYRVEFRQKTGQGDWKWILSIGSIVEWDTDGKPVRMLGVHIDIDEKRVAEEINTEISRRLEAITGSVYDGIIMADDLGKIVFWNTAAEKIFGYSNEEITGFYLHTMLAPVQYHEEHQAAFASFVQTGDGNAIGKTIELTGLKKDGTIFPMELSLSSLQHKGKWMAVGVVRDISERKDAEKQLKQKVDELERFNKLTVGRELKMIELKKEINQLMNELGKEKKYNIVDE